MSIILTGDLVKLPVAVKWNLLRFFSFIFQILGIEKIQPVQGNQQRHHHLQQSSLNDSTDDNQQRKRKSTDDNDVNDVSSMVESPKRTLTDEESATCIFNVENNERK